jgi:hypothetical protein
LVAGKPTVTGHRMSQNEHREAVLTITLVGEHVYRRFATRMLDAQVEFHRMGRKILDAPVAKHNWRIDNTADGFRKHHVDGIDDPVVTIVIVGWHDIHRLAYNMLRWQVEFSAMGRQILKSHRRAVGRQTWRALWEMYHGTAEKPMTFTWKRDL